MNWVRQVIWTPRVRRPTATRAIPGARRAIAAFSVGTMAALGAGCGGEGAPDDTGDSPLAGVAKSTDPAASFTKLEQRLLGASAFAMSFSVTAEGAIQVDLDGMLDVSESEGVLLTASGTFAGEPVELSLTTDGSTYEFGNGPALVEAETPPYLREAVLMGLTRMGILHNLAMLSGNAPPDHADGGVAEWVTVDDFSADSAVDGGVAFDLTVAGEPSGSAVLQIDRDGQPVQRTQTVAFPTGEMRVRESYEVLVWEGGR